MRQLLEYLLRALTHVARPREDERHRADGVGHQTQADLVTGVTDALAGVVAVPAWGVTKAELQDDPLIGSCSCSLDKGSIRLLVQLLLDKTVEPY